MFKIFSTPGLFFYFWFACFVLSCVFLFGCCLAAGVPQLDPDTDGEDEMDIAVVSSNFSF